MTAFYVSSSQVLSDFGDIFAPSILGSTAGSYGYEWSPAPDTPSTTWAASLTGIPADKAPEYLSAPSGRFENPIIIAMGSNLSNFSDGIDGTITTLSFGYFVVDTNTPVIEAVLTDVAISEGALLSALFPPVGGPFGNINRSALLDLVGAYAGTINTGESDDTVQHSGLFRQANRIDLGDGDDRFEFEFLNAGLTQTYDGGEGTDIFSLGYPQFTAFSFDFLNVGAGALTAITNYATNQTTSVSLLNFEEYHFNNRYGKFAVGSAEKDVFKVFSGIGIEGSFSTRTISGLDGDDEIIAEVGVNLFNGDGGDDLLVGGAGRDTLNGGADDDTIVLTTGDAIVDGGTGWDILRMAEEIWDLDFVLEGDAISIVDRTATGEREISARAIEGFEFAGASIDLATDVKGDARHAPNATDESGSDGYLWFNAETGEGMFFAMAQQADEDELDLVDPLANRPDYFDMG